MLTLSKQSDTYWVNTLRALLLGASLSLPLACGTQVVMANESDNTAQQMRALKWHIGPSTQTVLDKANLRLEKEAGFLDATESEKFLKLTGNLPQPDNNILMSNNDNWWADFSFDPVGYVKDDETIDADKLLKDLKSSDEPANAERQRQGLAPLYTEGWYIPPHYDSQNKHLEWALKLNSEGETYVNYTVRLLGRTGVMSATLVSSPETLDQDVKEFKHALDGFDFLAGERYSEFKKGDKIAEYGLAALIAGGAAAVATKKGFWALMAGFFAAAWKFIAVGVVAIGSWLSSLFKKR